MRIIRGLRLLRVNVNYRRLWLAKVGSLFGDWFNQVSLAQITLEMTHSASSMGLVLLCRSIPGVVLGPIVGPLVDRWDKKVLLMVSDILRALFAVGYIGASVWHLNWILYACSLLLGLAGVMFNPARSGLIPLVVETEDLLEANALESGVTGILQVMGALIGGFVALAFSPVICFLINSLSYVWSATCVGRVQWTESTIPQRQQSLAYVHQLSDGFREVKRNRVAFAIILIGISWGLAGGGYYILIPILGSQVYHLGGMGVGMLYAVDGVGVVIGSFFVRRFIGQNHRLARLWYGLAYISQAVFFGLMTSTSGVLFGTVTLLFMRISSGIIIPLDTYLLQTSTEPQFRGRVFILHSSTYGGVMQVSYALSGYAFGVYGIPLTGIIIGCISLLCGLSWLKYSNSAGVISKGFADGA